MSSLQAPVTFDSANRKADKTLSLRFTTNFEISTDDFAEFDKQVGSDGWMLFKQNKSFDESEVPTEEAPTQEKKTKAQRMRAVWFLVWKKRNVDEPFDTWYDKRFESLMDKWKEELD